jgi:hypothetical protein
MNKIRMAGALAGTALVSGMVLQVSSAAFSDTTENPGNSWAAGTVALSDSRAGSAMFAAVDMVPGDGDSQCIEVTYDGSVTPSEAIALHAVVTESADAVGNGLGDDLDVTVEVGPAGADCTTTAAGAGTSIYTGALSGFHAAADPLTTGWTPDAEDAAADMRRPFWFTITLGDDTPNDAQGDGATAAFTWSATS